MSDPLELANTLFPPPPAYYKAFTNNNVARHAELTGINPAGSSGTSKSRAGPEAVIGVIPDAELPTIRREGLIEAEQSELKELEEQLKPPRADLVVEDGKWSCFGQQYDVRFRLSLLPRNPHLSLSLFRVHGKS